MNITIKINCDNAAFYEWHPSAEVKRILLDLAKKVGADGLRDMKIMDANGNSVGKFEVSE